MRHLRLLLLLALAATLLLAPSSALAAGKGHSSSQLEKAGWTCVNAGPHNWTHCFNPGFDPTGESINVKVFSEDGSAFLGTELLLRADLYQGQPCMQDGGGEYELLPAAPLGPFPVDYRACHHFATH